MTGWMCGRGVYLGDKGKCERSMPGTRVERGGSGMNEYFCASIWLDCTSESLERLLLEEMDIWSIGRVGSSELGDGALEDEEELEEECMAGVELFAGRFSFEASGRLELWD